jgi:hypothetical protein
MSANSVLPPPRRHQAANADQCPRFRRRARPLIRGYREIVVAPKPWHRCTGSGVFVLPRNARRAMLVRVSKWDDCHQHCGSACSWRPPRRRSPMTAARRRTRRSRPTGRASPIPAAGNVIRQIEQHLQARRNAQAQSGVCPIEHFVAVVPAQIDAVLVLQAADRRHHAPPMTRSTRKPRRRSKTSLLVLQGGCSASPISRRKSGRSLRGCASTGPPRDHPVKSPTRSNRVHGPLKRNLRPSRSRPVEAPMLIRSRCTFTRLSHNRNVAWIADRTKAGFAAAKARGIKLGNAKLGRCCWARPTRRSG